MYNKNNESDPVVCVWNIYSTIKILILISLLIPNNSKCNFDFCAEVDPSFVFVVIV